jgi:hypothetical protein
MSSFARRARENDYFAQHSGAHRTSDHTLSQLSLLSDDVRAVRVVSCPVPHACCPAAAVCSQDRYKILAKLPVKNAAEKTKLFQKYSAGFWRWFSEIRFVRGPVFCCRWLARSALISVLLSRAGAASICCCTVWAARSTCCTSSRASGSLTVPSSSSTVSSRRSRSKRSAGFCKIFAV